MSTHGFKSLEKNQCFQDQKGSCVRDGCMIIFVWDYDYANDCGTADDFWVTEEVGRQ